MFEMPPTFGSLTETERSLVGRLKAASGDLGVASVEMAVALPIAVPTVIAAADGASVKVEAVFGSPKPAIVGLRDQGTGTALDFAVEGGSESAVAVVAAAAEVDFASDFSEADGLKETVAAGEHFELE